MTTTDEILSWQDTGVLEENFMEASQGSARALAVLHRTLESVPPGAAASWPAAVREHWIAGIELFLGELDRSKLSDKQVEFICQIMRAGLDAGLLRDFLVAIARRTFSAYLDPAGMISALGILDDSLRVDDICRRWQVFSELREGAVCCHPVHGKGTIKEVDDIANEVRLQFSRVLNLSLEQGLGSLVIVKKKSTLEKVLTGKSDAAALAGKGDDLVLASLASTLSDCSFALPLLLGGDAASQLNAAAPVVKVSRIVPAVGSGRRWDEARSIVELVEILQNIDSVDIHSGSADALRELWLGVADRPDSTERFSVSVARLWWLTGGADWLAELLAGIRENVYSWRTGEVFSSVCDGMAGRLVPYWLDASCRTLSPEGLAKLGMAFPLRLWQPLEKAVLAAENGEDALLGAVQDALSSSSATPDQAVWLWKSDRPERALLCDVSLIFRLLSVPANGSYIKAAKELRKLLLESADFQRFLMRDGDASAIASIVSCARHLAVLTSGEQQSLLVRIVRLYPDSKPLVEQKQKVMRKKAIAKQTSLRSYELRRRELRQIVNVKIPENSRAIAHARSYGDLRENAEYKAAKEEQAYLGARRGELEEALTEIQPVDFAHVDVENTVIPGCTAKLRLDDETTVSYHILGLWDSTPEKNMISYDTPLGRALMGMKCGESLTMPSGKEATLTEVTPLEEEMIVWLRGDDLG